MADLRIVDAPEILLQDVEDGLKLPTGGFGNYAITTGTIADWLIRYKDLALKSYVDSELYKKADKTFVESEITNLGTASKYNVEDLPVSDAQKEINQKTQDQIKNTGDYSSDYQTLSEATSETQNGVLNVVQGTYDGNVELQKYQIEGQGYNTLINVNPNSFGLKSLQTLPNWDRTRVKDLSFKGLSKVGTVGFTFDPSDPVSGRRNLDYCTFENLDIAIHKPTGNIGNTYSNLNIHDCNYAIKATSVWTPIEMHSGNDTWRDFQVDNIDVWAFDYVDTTGGGAIHIKDGIIEYCNGGGIRIECSDSLPPFIPPRISNVWFEGVAKSNSVTRDGVSEKPSDIKLVKTPMCYIENCTLSSIELVDSTAIISNSRVDRLRDVTLENSNLIVENAFLHGAVSKDLFISSVSKQSYPSASGGDLTLRTVDKKGVTQELSNALTQVGVTYQGNKGKFWEVYGTEQFYATSLKDGVNLNLVSGNTYRLPLVNTPENTWVVWGISAKKESTVTGDFKFNLDYNVGDIVFNEDDIWAHSFGIARTPTNSGTRLCATFTPTSNGSIQFKNYFIATFSEESEALAFLNSKFSLNTYPTKISALYNPVSLDSNQVKTTIVEFFGVSEGDNVVVAYNTNLKGTKLRAVVTSQNTVTVYHENTTLTTVTLDAGTLNLQLV